VLSGSASPGARCGFLLTKDPPKLGNILEATSFLYTLCLNPHNPTLDCGTRGDHPMHSIIYLVGLVVVVLFVLSLLGLH
jgi:hypothetical protein